MTGEVGIRNDRRIDIVVATYFCHCEPEQSEGVAIWKFEIASSLHAPRNDRRGGIRNDRRGGDSQCHNSIPQHFQAFFVHSFRSDNNYSFVLH